MIASLVISPSHAPFYNQLFLLLPVYPTVPLFYPCSIRAAEVASMEPPVYIFREESGPTCAPGSCSPPSSSSSSRWLLDWTDYDNNNTSRGIYEDLQQNHTNISPAIPIIITAVYSVVFVVGLVGNSLVMFVIIRYEGRLFIESTLTGMIKENY